MVCDFGLAKLTEQTHQLTKADEIMGTPSYMSPEQTKDSAEITTRSDVYSLGASLYHAITGRPPFQAANPLETLRQAQFEEPVAPSVLNADIDRDLETICIRCLQKDPSRRYETAAAVREDLNRYLEVRYRRYH